MLPRRTGTDRQERRVARRLAKARTPDAAKALARMYAESTDAGVRDTAAVALAALRDQAAVNAACEVAMATGDERLRELLAGAGHQPSDPAPRTLWLLLDGRAEQAAELDYDGSLLRAACRGADAGLRARVAGHIRSAGRLEWVRSLAGGPDSRDLAGLSAQEWDATADVLTAARRWEEIWRLAHQAPLPRAAALLRILGRNGWEPGEDTAHLIALARGCAPASVGGLYRAPVVVADDGRSPWEVITNPGGTLFGLAQGMRVRLWRPRDVEPGADQVGEIAVQRVWGQPAISPDERVVAVGDETYQMRLVSPDGEQLAESWSIERYGITHLVFASDSALLAARCYSGRVWVREVPSGRVVWSARAHPAGRGRSQAIAADAGVLVTAALTSDLSDLPRVGARVRLWRLDTGERLGEIELGLDGELSDMAVSPDGSRLVVLRSSCAEIWDLHSGTRVARRDLAPAGHDTWVTVILTPDGRHVILGGTLDGRAGRYRAEVRRTDDGEVVGRANLGTDRPYTHLAVSPDSRLLIDTAYTRAGKARAWQLPSGQLVGALPGGAHAFGAVSFLADGSVVSMAGHEEKAGAVLLWQPEPVLSGRVPVTACELAEAERLRSLTADGPDRAWGELLYGLVRWRHRHDITLGGPGPQPSGTDIEVDRG